MTPLSRYHSSQSGDGNQPWIALVGRHAIPATAGIRRRGPHALWRSQKTVRLCLILASAQKDHCPQRRAYLRGKVPAPLSSKTSSRDAGQRYRNAGSISASAKKSVANYRITAASTKTFFGRLELGSPLKILDRGAFDRDCCRADCCNQHRNRIEPWRG
jgi:hypothetical protein